MSQQAKLMASGSLMMEAIRDEVAKIAGVDDGPRGPIRWEYAQEKCKRGTFGVRVEITSQGD